MPRKVVAVLVLCALTLLPVVALAATPPASLEAPQNLRAELWTDEYGKPYFQLTWDIPASVGALNTDPSEAPLYYQIDLRVDGGAWDYATNGDLIQTGNMHSGEDLINTIPYNPYDSSETEAINIQAHTYTFRVRFAYCWTDEEGYDHYVYGAFSNLATVGTPAYQGASSWAVPELDKAVGYGFITDKIKGNMAGYITREEFCEVVMILYEQLTGETATSTGNPFSDTNNPEVLEAAELGIVKGMGAGKFVPDNLVTRQEISVMLTRAIRLCRPEIDTAVTGVGPFKDEAKIASWAIEAVRFMSKNGIMKGEADGSINPLGNTTREQAVLLVVRTFEKFEVGGSGN